MPPLRNPRREAFAQHLAAGTKLFDAYEQAGFTSPRGNANRLEREPEVQTRVAELRSQINPADISNLEYIAAKVRDVAEQIVQSAGDRDAAARLANDLRRLATALDQQAGIDLDSSPRVARSPDSGHQG